ncbi:MAG: tetratricopeptide repeat protein [Phycisphaerae bacterium]
MTSINNQAHDQVRKLAEQGDFEQALEQVNAYLTHTPGDAEALNDAGAILFAMGRFDEAIDRLCDAIDRMPGETSEATWNLAEVTLAAGKPEETLPLLVELAEAQMLRPDLAIRAASALLDRGLTAQAVEALVLLKQLSDDDGDDVAESTLAVLRNHRPKVSLFYLREEEKLVEPIRHFIGERFNTRWSSEQDAERLERLLQWSDVAWFESCDSMLTVASRNPGLARVVCHLKMYKASNPWIDETQWENVDLLIVPDPTIGEAICARVEGLAEKTRIVTVPNGLNMEHLPERPGRRPGSRVACLGYDNYRMSPEMLDVFLDAMDRDPRLGLNLAAETSEDMPEHSLRRELGEKCKGRDVGIEGLLSDPILWLENKQFVLATNRFAERTPLVAECMALGIKPLVFVPEGDTPGILAEQFGFHTTDELLQRLNEPWEPARYRRLVEEEYSMEAQLGRINALLTELEADWAPASEAA